MAQIRITPEELRNASSFLMQRLDAINNEVSSLKAKIDEVTGNWEGASQSSFIETFENDMYPILKDTLPQVVEGISGQLDGAADAIEHATIVSQQVEERVEFSFPYVMMNQVMRIVKEMGPRVVSQSYDNTCQIVLSIRKSNAEMLRQKLNKLSFGE